MKGKSNINEKILPILNILGQPYPHRPSNIKQKIEYFLKLFQNLGH